LVLVSESEKFIFNAGEGLQRMCMEHKVKLGKLTNILLTRLSPDTFGGLPGMLLTIADCGMKKITIHGPKGVNDAIRASRSFAMRDDMQKEFRDLDSNWSMTSSGIKFDVVRVSKTMTVGVKREREEKQQSTFGMVKNFLNLSQSETTDEDCCYCFVAETSSTPGKLLIDKVRNLGIQPGPQLGHLKAGKAVECKLKNGSTRVVQPSEVVEPGQPPSRFAIVDCPTKHHISSLISRMKIHADSKATSSNERKETSLVCVAHFAPLEVITDPAYSKWAQEFSPSAQHVLLHPSCCGQQTVWWASELNLLKLRMLAPSVFPEPLEKGNLSSLEVKGFITGKHLAKFRVYPFKAVGWDNSGILTPPDQKAIEESLERYGVSSQELQKKLEAFHEANSEVKETSYTMNNSAMDVEEKSADAEKYTIAVENDKTEEKKTDSLFDPEILFTGTGSAIPSKYRNVAGIYVRLQGDIGFLMDCGESTYYQLLRKYGSDMDSILAGLEFVWISHMHADHHLGLLTILDRRNQILRKSSKGIEIKPLIIFGPKKLELWISSFNRISNLDAPFIFVKNELISDSFWTRVQSPSEDIVQVFQRIGKNGVKSIKTVRVTHCQDAWAVILEHQSGWKLSYSGDCRPSSKFATAAQGSNVLIHEATFEDSLMKEAIARKHSTIGEAVGVGRNMCAERVLLTHFSQRYPKIPDKMDPVSDVSSVDNGTRTDFKMPERVGIAFDLMQIRLGNLHWLPKLLEPLRWIFPADVEIEDEEKQAI